MLDFGPQANWFFALLAHSVGWLDGETRLRDNWAGRIPELMRDAGFASADELGRALTPFGSVSFYKAVLK